MDSAESAPNTMPPFSHLQNGVSSCPANVSFPKGGALRQGAGWGHQLHMQAQAGVHKQEAARALMGQGWLHPEEVTSAGFHSTRRHCHPCAKARREARPPHPVPWAAPREAGGPRGWGGYLALPSILEAGCAHSGGTIPPTFPPTLSLSLLPQPLACPLGPNFQFFISSVF